MKMKSETPIVCTMIVVVGWVTTVLITTLIQTPLYIDEAQYEAIQAEYAYNLNIKNAENKRLELRIVELKLLADKL